MAQIEWSEEAQEDLDNILSYFSKSSIQYAKSFFERIHETLEYIKKFPQNPSLVLLSFLQMMNHHL